MRKRTVIHPPNTPLTDSHVVAATATITNAQV